MSTPEGITVQNKYAALRCATSNATIWPAAAQTCQSEVTLAQPAKRSTKKK